MRNHCELDSLDELRYEMDNLQILHPDWEFRVLDAGPDYPDSTVRLEAYSKKFEKYAAMLLTESMYVSVTNLKGILRNLSVALRKVEDSAGG